MLLEKSEIRTQHPFRHTALPSRLSGTSHTRGSFLLHYSLSLFPWHFTPLTCRCNFALMLLTELVVDRCAIKWNIFLPKLLHMAFLGK